jgi:hypothetical protein
LHSVQQRQCEGGRRACRWAVRRQFDPVFVRRSAESVPSTAVVCHCGRASTDYRPEVCDATPADAFDGRHAPPCDSRSRPRGGGAGTFSAVRRSRGIGLQEKSDTKDKQRAWTVPAMKIIPTTVKSAILRPSPIPLARTGIMSGPGVTSRKNKGARKARSSLVAGNEEAADRIILIRQASFAADRGMSAMGPRLSVRAAVERSFVGLLQAGRVRAPGLGVQRSLEAWFT